MSDVRTIFGTFKNFEIITEEETLLATVFHSHLKKLEGQTGIFNIYYDFDRWVIFQYILIDEMTF